MSWMLFIVFISGKELLGSFDTEQECYDALIANAISAGFQEKQFEGMYCVKEEKEES